MVMVQILVKCKKYDEAIAKLDYVLSLNGWYTVRSIALDKLLDPLRDRPAYQGLLRKYAMKPAT